MSSMRRAVLPIPRKASSRNAGSLKCTGRFLSIRLSEVAAFFRSCTKNSDIVRNASSSRACATSAGKSMVDQDRRHLIGDACQQLQFLDRVNRRIDAIREHDHADNSVSGTQGDTQPVPPLVKVAELRRRNSSAQAPLAVSKSKGADIVCSPSRTPCEAVSGARHRRRAIVVPSKRER